MNSQLTPHPSPSRYRGPALAGSAVLGLTGLDLSLARLSRSAWLDVSAPGPADPGQVISAVCGSLATALVAWLLAALLMSLAAALGSPVSTCGRVADRVARRLAPRLLRNATAAMLGAVIAAGPATAAGGASDLEGPPGAGRLVPPAAAELSPAWVPHVPAASGSPTAPAIGIAPGLVTGWVPAQPSSVPTIRPRPTTGPAPVGTATVRPGFQVDDEIVVHRGDTLWSLAARHLGPGATDGEIAVEWPHWFTTNRDVIGADPDHLVPGERLRAPEARIGAAWSNLGTENRQSPAADRGHLRVVR